MNTLIFLSIFVLLGLISFIVGLRSSKGITTNVDFFLAGRQLGLAAVTFTLIATQLGGGMMLGIAQKSYTIGYLGIFYALGMSIGFVILGSGLAAKLRSFEIATTAELFETKYKSLHLKKIASLISALTLGGLLLGQIAASKSLLIGLGIDNSAIFVLFWLLIIGYTMVGGLKAVVVTDIFQVLFIIASFGSIFLYVLFNDAVSLFNPTTVANIQQLFPEGMNQLLAALPALLMPALFSLIEQDLAQRFFAAKTQRIAIFSALLAGTFMILFAFVPLFFGMKAHLLNMAVPAGANPLVSALAFYTTPFFFALGIGGLIAAIASTADSLLCAISSHIAQDFDFSVFGFNDKLKVSQVVTLATGLCILGISYLVHQDIIDILVESYTLAVSCLFVPIFFCFFKQQFNTYAAAGAMLLGFLGFVFFIFFPTPVPQGILPLALSFVGYGLGSLYHK